MSRPMRGTTYEQDPRYKDKEAKLLSSYEWPLEYTMQVDMSKVDLDSIKTWISKQTTELLGVEDEILSTLIISLLEEPNACPKKIQIQIGGFLENNTEKFVLKLWRLLLSAQDNPLGIPQQLINERRDELLRKKRELEKMRESIKEQSRKKRKSRSRSNEHQRYRRHHSRSRS